MTSRLLVAFPSQVVPSVVCWMGRRRCAMVREDHIGRVGALAVALGIGWAVVGLAGEAQAEPDGATASAGTSQRADARADRGTKVADRPWRGRARASTDSDD